MKINKMIELFGVERRWAEDNVSRLHRKGYLAQSGMGFRYKVSKKGNSYCTEIFQRMNKVGTPYDLEV